MLELEVITAPVMLEQAAAPVRACVCVCARARLRGDVPCGAARWFSARGAYSRDS